MCNSSSVNNNNIQHFPGCLCCSHFNLFCISVYFFKGLLIDAYIFLNMLLFSFLC